jgi:hypothetical protein
MEVSRSAAACPAEPPEGCGSPMIVPGPGGRPVAVGTCRHDWIPPDSMEMLWGAAVRYVLTAQVGGTSAEEGLDRLLRGWRMHLRSLPGTADADTAAMLTWPSRDISGVRALLAHGMQALTVIAARPAHRAVPPSRCGASIRQAGPGDLAEVLALHMAEVHDDVHFGGAVERPGTSAVLRREMERALVEPGGWRWLAEVDGRPAGLLLAEPPEGAGWVAPLTGLAPAAYLCCRASRPRSEAEGGAATLSPGCMLNWTARELPSRCCTTVSSTPCRHRSGTGWDTGRCGPRVARSARALR